MALDRERGFVAAAVATFALGIGAATAIFSVVYGVAFRPLPYPQSHELVRIYESNTATNELKLHVSEGTFQAWRESLTSVEDIALYTAVRTRYTRGDAPQSVAMMAVSPRFFAVLRVAPLHGRTFKDESEYGRGKTDELVISYDLWQRMFRGDLNVIGRTLDFVSGEDPFVIVGVMPPSFRFDAQVDAWRPAAIALPISRAARSQRFDRVVARLRSDRSNRQLQAELDVTSARLAREFPASHAGWIATTEPLRDAIIGRFATASWLLLLSVAAALLAACANIAGLLNARAVSRMRETSIRIALGAGRWQLAKMWLREAFALAAAGAVLGVAMAWWLVYALRAAAPDGLPRVEDIAVDLTALAFASAATVITAVVCALVPVSIRRRDHPSDVLKAGSAHAGIGPRQHRLGASLIAVQSAAALALVVVSLVFARSFLNLIAVDLGWQPARVLTMQVAPRWPEDVRRPWFLAAAWGDRLTKRLDALPGVVAAAITTVVPFSPETHPAEIARGQNQIPDEARWPITLHSVTDGYFAAMGLTLRRGRLFANSDRFDERTLNMPRSSQPGVAIVTESVARLLWPGEQAIGQRLRVLPIANGPFQEVVGVVADIQFVSVGAEPVLNVFVPWMQNPTLQPRLAVRTTGDPVAILPFVRAEIFAEHGATAIDRVTPMETLVNRALAPSRVVSQLMLALGVFALLLAGVGVYGSLSLVVHANARETALRLAVGASPAQTLRRTMRRGLAPVMIGAIGGVVLATALVAMASDILYGVNRADLTTMAVGASIVLLACGVACSAPALRAARTDPMTLLRN